MSARRDLQAAGKWNITTVVVREAATGAIEIRYRGRLLRWTEIAAPAPAPAASAVRPPVPRVASPPRAPRRPLAGHPWQHGVEERRAHLELAAAKRARRAVQP